MKIWSSVQGTVEPFPKASWNLNMQGNKMQH